MNQWQKQVQQKFLNNEKAVINRLEKVYAQSQKDINAKIKDLQLSIDGLQMQYDWMDDSDPQKAQIKSMIQSKIHQKQYQQALGDQVDGILKQMQTSQYLTVSDYLNTCYEDGFVGAVFDLHGQNVPMMIPLDQTKMVQAVQLDSKISQGLYTKLGVDVGVLKGRITAEVSRSIATGASYADTARNLANVSRIGYNNAIRIARTEGHRIQTTAAMHVMERAKANGADVVKQWDAALDKRTRDSHAKVDGEIREVNKEFSNGLMYPGDPHGPAAEVINCRCALLQRAKWGLDDDELKALQDKAAFFGLDKTDQFDEFKQKYLQAMGSPATPKPQKKEYLTKNKLQQKIADIDKQLATATDPAVIQDLMDQKADYQTKLDEKINAAELKKLKKETILLQDQLDNFQIDTYSGIWKDDVTTKDWLAKKDAIPKKKAYFEQQLKYATDPADIAKWQGLLDDLDDFDQKGKAYYDIQKKLTTAKNSLKNLQNGGKINTASSAFTQDRKDAALWAKSTKAADDRLRDVSGEVWRNANRQERYAIYDYTSGSGKFNRPLSGFEKPYSASGTGWEPKWNKGVGKVWIDYEGAGDEIRQMTDLISRSSYDFDIWLQRGCGNNAMESFLGLSPGAFGRMSEADLQQFVGQSNRMYSFTSTGVAKGKGFSGDCILNIYAPEGTQMMYAEPFSAFGHGGKLNWDGTSPQSTFGYESEMIIQRGASYTITKIEKSGGITYIDMEVHPEMGYELIQQDPSEWTGSTLRGR